MRKPCIPDLIYQKTFPKPKQGEPASFYAHIQRHIVNEVRAEVQMYYGALDTLEAQYPGLDYSSPAHRRRLSKHPWHRRLFRVFEDLRLTDNEILSLCQWEGTRAAKERYEQESGTQIRSTTTDDIAVAPRGSGPRAVFEDWARPASVGQTSDADTVVQVEEKEDVDSSQEETDTPSSAPSDGFLELLRDAMRERLEGDSSFRDQVWEQWLKETLEQHEMDLDTAMTAIRSLEPDLRRTGDGAAENTSSSSTSTTPRSLLPTPQSDRDSSYDGLHTLVGELQSNNNQLAANNAALALFLTRSQTEAAR
jgi:hypothetical protein